MVAETPTSKRLKYAAGYLALTMLGRAVARATDELLARAFAETPGRAAWKPNIDVYDRPDTFIVRAEVPDVGAEDITVTVAGDSIRIAGERRPPPGVSAKEAEKCEMCYGPFSRSVALPETAQKDNMEATLEKGILEVRLRKLPASESIVKIVPAVQPENGEQGATSANGK